MTHSSKHPRHFEIGEFVLYDADGSKGATEADIMEVIGYTPEGLARMIYPTGLQGIFKSRKEAVEFTGHEPRRCTLAGITVWQGVYTERCADLTGIDEIATMANPLKNALLHYSPRNAREKQPTTTD